MKFFFLSLAISSCSLLVADPRPSSELALNKLLEGNERFINESSICPNRVAERRGETVKQQNPFAIILGCSDSRVSPEILFDQGIGDLFIVRIAGNVCGPIELDSIEYSALYLHSSLIMVLGHENCGAVNAVLGGTTKDIESIAQLIQPAVEAIPSNSADRLKRAIIENVKRVTAELSKTEVLSRLIASKQLAVVGGYYDLHTGRVEIVSH